MQAAALAALEEAGRAELVRHICRELAHKFQWQNRTDACKEVSERGLRMADAARRAGVDVFAG